MITILKSGAHEVSPGEFIPADFEVANIYRDNHDWWIGYYRGDEHHYVVLIPTVVIRWRRR